MLGILNIRLPLNHSKATFDVDFNLLEGSLPTEIGQMSSLDVLFLDSNRLTGMIPSELGNLEGTLDRVSLSRNRLEGMLPSEICSLISDLSFFGVDCGDILCDSCGPSVQLKLEKDSG